MRDGADSFYGVWVPSSLIPSTLNPRRRVAPFARPPIGLLIIQSGRPRKGGLELGKRIPSPVGPLWLAMYVRDCVLAVCRLVAVAAAYYRFKV